MITALYSYYYDNVDALPEFYLKELLNSDKNDVLCDYISGMSDDYAIKTFTGLFIPDKWQI